jgi:hypothetical protein
MAIDIKMHRTLEGLALFGLTMTPLLANESREQSDRMREVDGGGKSCDARLCCHRRLRPEFSKGTAVLQWRLAQASAVMLCWSTGPWTYTGSPPRWLPAVHEGGRPIALGQPSGGPYAPR